MLGDIEYSLADRAEAGMPIYAECGRLMYLGRSLTGFDKTTHSMAGVLPLDVGMDNELPCDRYVKIGTLAPSLLGWRARRRKKGARGGGG